MIHIKKIKDFLNEQSYTKKDIPEYFYRSVEFDIHRAYLSANAGMSVELFIEEVNKGRLGKIQGVSADTIADVAKTKNAFFKFKGSDFEKINKLSKVLYGNHYYMGDKNAKAANRVLGDNIFKHFVENFLEDSIGYLKFSYNENGNLKNRLDSYFKDATLLDLIAVLEFINTGDNSLDFAEYMEHVTSKNFNKASKKILDYIKNILGYTGKINLGITSLVQRWVIERTTDVYEEEQEWLIKTQHTSIPKSTILFVTEKIPTKVWEKLQKELSIEVRMVSKLVEIYK